ncbi:MAG: hypothetical protein LC781_00185 [Actinobacteria bacterium]|nr:hypothetical protein [Actinomycetota bacterium]
MSKAVLGGLGVFAFVDTWLEWASPPGDDWSSEIGPGAGAALGSAGVARRTFGIGRWQ